MGDGALRAHTTDPPAVRNLLVAADHSLADAAHEPVPARRYAMAHLAALRAAAAVLAARARPSAPRRPASAWVLLTAVAPELTEWATFFAAGAAKRAAAEAGLRGAVSAREADDLVRDAGRFLDQVSGLLEPAVGLPLFRAG
ncbi:MAG: SAV_6107 family HEPN domain-containing protein [Mycobacteriales bacterium]